MAEDISEDLPFGISDLPSEPLGDFAHSLSPSELAGMRMRRAARGSDVTRRLESPAAARLASTALGLAPFAGITDALGGLPDFEKGGFHPSLGANLSNGDIGAAGWQALGVLGDAMYLAPGVGPALGSTVGTILKSGRATQLAQRSARPDLFNLSNPVRRHDLPQVDVERYSPPRGVPSRTADLLNNPEVASEMRNIIEAARKAGTDWYNTEPLRQAYIKELGPADGEAAYNMFLSHVAAASPSSDVGDSIRKASYYSNRWRSGEGLPQVGDAVPYPYGHVPFVQRLHQRLAALVHGEGFDPIRHAKVLSFLENLRGNYAPVTIDMHAFRLPAIISGDERFLTAKARKMISEGKLTDKEAFANPRNLGRVGRNEYAAMEQFYKKLAQEAGLTPAQAQAAAWVGGANRTGLRSKQFDSFLEFLQDRIRRTADKEGLEDEEALRRFTRGELNLVARDEPINPVA